MYVSKFSLPLGAKPALANIRDVPYRCDRVRSREISPLRYRFGRDDVAIRVYSLICGVRVRNARVPFREIATSLRLPGSYHSYFAALAKNSHLRTVFTALRAAASRRSIPTVTSFPRNDILYERVWRLILI